MRIACRPFVAALVTFSIVLVATSCGSGADEATGPSQAGSNEAAATSEEWLFLPITDVSGQTFTIESLQGKPVFVENFATWCSNCLKQLGKTQQAAASAGDDAVFVALSVETDLDAGEVGDYAQDNGFDDIRFAVMTPEFLAAMEDAYGKSALNPPSTPKIVVDAEGAPGKMTTGFEDPDQIAEAIAPA